MVTKAVTKEAEKTTKYFENLPKKNYFYGCGKRKTSIASVRLYEGQGNVFINGKPMKEHLKLRYNESKILSPLKELTLDKHFDIYVVVKGGGENSGAEAIRHGIARALLTYDISSRARLKKAGFLTRDSRIKERKKYGLKRARRAPQWQKR